VTSQSSISLVDGDITRDFAAAAREVGVSAWDLETSGLDWAKDRIGTCQVHVPGLGVEIVTVGKRAPERLATLLSSARDVKVFHHAAFDLRFMRFHWGVRAASINCTKVQAKIALPGRGPKAYSLKPLVSEFVGVSLDKSLQVSDWTSRSLSDEQLAYAAGDVLYLVQLRDALGDVASREGVGDLVDASFSYLPTRVETDVRGCGDVFAY
jgi:ribonuclease D